MKCELCHKTEGIHAHYMDGNPCNESPGNTMNLCERCHRKVHFYMLKEMRAEPRGR